MDERTYTQADLDAAVAAALTEAAAIVTQDIEAVRAEEGKFSATAFSMEQDAASILAMIPDAGAALDRALAAQREKDAKVAETYEQWATDFGPLNPEDVAEQIAAAIRAQGG